MLLKRSGLCFFFFTLLARFFLFAFKERIILRNRRHSLRPRSLNIKEEIIEEFLDEREKKYPIYWEFSLRYRKTLISKSKRK